MSFTLIPPGKFKNWLRYFPFELRNWKRVISDSGLPDEAKQLIRSVVSQSRLMRFEKHEVIHEFIGHFADGLLAGKSINHLVSQFGDPVVTAKLIRRSKIRNRPIMFKAVQIFGWFVLALFSVYAVIWGYFHSGSPSPTTDYLAEFNDSIRETDEDQIAWSLYRPVWIKYEFSEGGSFHEQMKELYVHTPEEQYKDLLSPGDDGWDRATVKLTEWSDLLNAFREGAKRERLGVEIHADFTRYTSEDFEALFPGRDQHERQKVIRQLDDDVEEIFKDATINVLLPHLQAFRTAARIFIVDTRWAMEQGDTERAKENIRTMFGLGRQVSKSNTLIGTLVGYAVGGIAIGTLEDVLLENPSFFDESQLAELQTMFENESMRDWLNLAGEKNFLMDIVQRVYTDDGKGDGRVTSTGLRFLQNSMLFRADNMPELEDYSGIMRAARSAAEPASLFFAATRKQTTEKIDEFFGVYEENARENYWELDLTAELEIEDFLVNNKMKHMLLGMMLPAIGQVRSAMNRMVGNQEGVIAALAIHRYFIQHGEWPNSIVDLSPEFVTELPVDIINGKFLNLKQDDQGPVIYSVGNDKDDDGGVQVVDERGYFVPSYSWVGGSSQVGDGDWILWPQSRYDKKGFANNHPAKSSNVSK